MDLSLELYMKRVFFLVSSSHYDFYHYAKYKLGVFFKEKTNNNSLLCNKKYSFYDSVKDI